MNTYDETMNDITESMEGIHFEDQIAGVEVPRARKVRKGPIDLGKIYANVWHALDTLQQLELAMIAQNKEIRGIDLANPLQQLVVVLTHMDPNAKLPSVYACDNDSDDDLWLE